MLKNEARKVIRRAGGTKLSFTQCTLLEKIVQSVYIRKDQWNSKQIEDVQLKTNFRALALSTDLDERTISRHLASGDTESLVGMGLVVINPIPSSKDLTPPLCNLSAKGFSWTGR